MEPVTIIAAGLIGTAGIGALQLWFSDRQWVAVWRGHRIRVQHHEGRVIVEMDGQVILSQRRMVFRRAYAAEWSHPALGETTIALSKIPIGSQGEFSLAMTIGEERVPLIELERSWRGARTLIGLQTRATDAPDALWESLSHTAVEPMGDARWLAACRLLDLSRQSSAMTAEMRENANLLQSVLRRSFEARRRLGDDALGALGALGEPAAAQVPEARAALEARITAALEAVKSLHMAVISIETLADETDELNRVQQTLERLQADDEVERFLKQQALQRAPPKPLAR